MQACDKCCEKQCKRCALKEFDRQLKEALEIINAHVDAAKAMVEQEEKKEGKKNERM